MASRRNALSVKDLLVLAVSPFVSAVVNPIALLKTLRACRVLRNGRWRDYSGFAFGPAALRAFYWIEDMNLQKYGRDGISPLLAWGAFPLRHFWYQSMFALSVDRAVGGVVVALLGASAWIASHYPWLNDVNAVPVVVLLLPLIALCSNNFYGNVFGWQNYNLLGWAVFPAVVHGIVSGDFWGEAVGTAVAGMFSITVVAMTVPLAVVAAVDRTDPWPLLALIPAILLVVHRSAGAQTSQVMPRWTDFMRVLKMIGTSAGRYRRPRYIWQSMAVAVVLMILPVAMLMRGTRAFGMSAEALAVLNLVPIGGLVLAETRIFRWADIHSYLFAFVTISTGTTMASGDPYLIVAWWIANSNSAVGRMLFNFRPGNPDGWASVTAPFDIRPAQRAVEDLLCPVPASSRVWLAADDPGTEYNRVFDGYSDVYELAHYCGNRRDILVTPDWYAVALHSMDEHATSIWGRDAPSAVANASAFGADFILVYQKSDERLAEEYAGQGWSVLRTLDWSALQPIIGADPRLEIVWHLMGRAPLAA